MTNVCSCQQSLAALYLICQQAFPTKKGVDTEHLAVCGLALQQTYEDKLQRFLLCTNSTALAQARKEAEEAAAQAAATEESRQKAVGMGKPIFARSLKPLTEPKDVEFHTAKRQRMQGDAQADKVLNTRLQHCYLQKTMHSLTTLEKKKRTPQKKAAWRF